MLRILGVILLSLCVLAMPSYAAITCGTACAATSDAHEHDCCAAVAATDSAGGDEAGSPQNSKHSSDGRHHHCAAPCCGYVAHLLSAAAPRAQERPLADLLPTAAVLPGSVNHDAIFHPPRL